MKEIRITDISEVKIGQVENSEAGTGCTVLVSPNGMRAGLDVRGGGPASRESELLKPLAAASAVHGVALSGGSAFGLGVADGVMQCLEEHGIGYDVGVCRVPLVCQSSLFDLTVGRMDFRPGREDGYKAAEIALAGGNIREGNYGAGCGCTVGKLNGMEYCMKSGIGSYAIQIGELKIGAIVAVNALGDVIDWHTGKIVAGMLSQDRQGFADSVSRMKSHTEVVENRFTNNTTLGVIITNAFFDKTKLCKIAGMTHDGVARSIRPVHTSADGDSIYALSVGNVTADMDVVGSLAADVMSEAILHAVKSSESAYGYISARNLPFDFEK